MLNCFSVVHMFELRCPFMSVLSMSVLATGVLDYAAQYSVLYRSLLIVLTAYAKQACSVSKISCFSVQVLAVSWYSWK